MRRLFALTLVLGFFCVAEPVLSQDQPTQQPSAEELEKDKAEREKMVATIRYYFFLDRKLPHVVGHNAVAGAAYFLVFLLYLGMIVTGFTLYSEHAPGGLYASIFGWITHIFSNQSLRLIHHTFMWLIIGFVIQHVYSCWLMDIKERGGVISAMFSGYKSVEED